MRVVGNDLDDGLPGGGRAQARGNRPGGCPYLLCQVMGRFFEEF